MSYDRALEKAGLRYMITPPSERIRDSGSHTLPTEERQVSLEVGSVVVVDVTLIWQSLV